MRIVKASGTKTWATGAGHAAQTFTVGNLTGRLVGIGMKASEVTADPDVTVTVTDANAATLFTSGAKDDGAGYYFSSVSHKAAPDALFNPAWLVGETLTISIDPSADAGGAAQTLTVTVDLYLEIE